MMAVARPLWIGPLDATTKDLPLRGREPDSSVVEFAVVSDAGPSTIAVNIGTVGSALDWARRLGWSGQYDESPRGGIVGFDGAVRIAITEAEVSDIEVLTPEAELTPTEFRHLFTLERDAPSEQFRLDVALNRIRNRLREGLEPNLRRQLRWLGIQDGEVFAIQAIGSERDAPNYLALCRSVDEAVRLTRQDGLVAERRWGGTERFAYQGLYIVANRLVGRIDEVFQVGRWAVMPKGVLTDERIALRRHFYLDLDTQRRDERGKPLDLPISATREELRETIRRSLLIREEIVRALGSIGLDRPEDVIAFMLSGNGVQLWFALDSISEAPEVRAVIRELLAIWAGLYNSDASHVDTAVYDAKRIGPLAGTVKRKGIRTELHRPVTFDGAADPRQLTLDELRALVLHFRTRLNPEQRAIVAKSLGVRPPPTAPVTVNRRGADLRACNAIRIRDVATKLGIDPDKPICPGCGSGGGGSDVAFLDAPNVLNCKHNRCSARSNRTCVDLVAKIAFDCDTIQGTKGVAPKILGWFNSHFVVGGRS